MIIFNKKRSLKPTSRDEIDNKVQKILHGQKTERPNEASPLRSDAPPTVRPPQSSADENDPALVVQISPNSPQSPVSGTVDVGNFPAVQVVEDIAAESSLATIEAALPFPIPPSAAAIGSAVASDLAASVTPVSGPLTNTQLRATAVPVADSAAESSLATLVAALPYSPATQPISGTVSITAGQVTTLTPPTAAAIGTAVAADLLTQVTPVSLPTRVFSSSKLSPTAGSQAVFTVPVGRKWTVISAQAAAHLANTGAARQFQMNAQDASGNLFCLLNAGFSQAINTTNNYNYGNGFPYNAVSGQSLYPIPPLALAAGMELQFNIVSIAAGDTIVVTINYVDEPA